MEGGLNPSSFNRRPPLWAAALIGAAMVGIVAAIRLRWMNQIILPVGFGVPVVLMATLRYRSLLWITSIAFGLIASIKFGIVMPQHLGAEGIDAHSYSLALGGIALIELLGVTLVADRWIRSVGILDKRHAELQSRSAEVEKRNIELSAHREEIARQNEALRRQTDELARQSDELRRTNDELAQRRRILETLLDLSRAITIHMPRDQAFRYVCQTMSQLIPSSGMAVALYELAGEQYRLVCHSGYGAGGPDIETIDRQHAFAQLVADRGATVSLDDLSGRSDLRFSQPRTGDPLRSVVGAPLRFNGHDGGSLEVYSTARRPWKEHEIALVESVAAQLSLSIGGADLFSQVQDERRLLQTVLNVVPFGIGITNADGQRITFNPAGAAMFGTPGTVDGVRGGNVHSADVYQNGKKVEPQDYQLFRALRFGEQALMQEMEVRYHSGRRLTILAGSAPIRDRAGQITGAVTSFIDISNLKELQNEMDRRRRIAEEANIRKSRFLAAVSHDIRTPANAISLLAELIKRSAISASAPANTSELASDLHTSAISLLNLVSDVLDLTQLDSGHVDLHETEFFIGELLTADHRQLTPLAEEKQLEFLCIPPQPDICIRADQVKLSRVLINLIGNAIKFTHAGTVRVCAGQLSDGSMEIQIVDTGAGIPTEHHQRIFDEYFQLRNVERNHNNGTGLGLPISRRLVEAMNGTLSVRSEAGHGSTFIVTLPASVVVKPPAQSAAPAAR